MTSSTDMVKKRLEQKKKDRRDKEQSISIEKQIMQVKKSIKRFLPREDKRRFEEFGWGEYVHWPEKEGLIAVEGEFYTYRVSDRGGTTFYGPIPKEQLIGYVAIIYFGVEIPGQTIDYDFSPEMISCSIDELVDAVNKKVKT